MNILISLFAAAQLLAGFGALLAVMHRSSAPVRHLNQRGVALADRRPATTATIHPFRAAAPVPARSPLPQVAA